LRNISKTLKLVGVVKVTKMDNLEIRAVIKYLVKKGLQPRQIYDDMLLTLEDNAPSYSTVKKWAALFRFGRTSIEDDPRSGRPNEAVTSENVDKVHQLVMNDRRLTVRQMSEELGMSKSTVDRIVKEELEMTKVSARWVPKLLTADQKVVRRRMSRDNLNLFDYNPDEFLARFVTVDETWAHHFTPESKQQSMQWKHTDSPCPKKAKAIPSAGKVMVTVFWDTEGILLLDYLQKGQTITGTYYANLLMRLRDVLKIKRRGKLSRGVLFHQDNAPSHTSSVAMATIHDCGFQLLQHPPYSPDLAPSDYHLFPELKRKLSGVHFGTDDDVIGAVEDVFGAMDKTFYFDGIKALRHRWEKCVDLGGDYVEK
jgi:[histone H3]-lysine36 N-dimethyltransferase SETMAR